MHLLKFEESEQESGQFALQMKGEGAYLTYKPNSHRRSDNCRHDSGGCYLWAAEMLGEKFV